MSNNVEWAAARYAADLMEMVTPADFADEGGTYYDTGGAYYDTDEVDFPQYGVTIDSGGHTTLVYGTGEELGAFAKAVRTAVAEALHHEANARVESICFTPSLEEL